MATANLVRFRPVSKLKGMMLPAGSRPRRIGVGLYRGLVLNLDFRSQAQIYFGLWERETHGFIRRAVRAADWMIDVGAGSGELCTYFGRTRPSRPVFAVEPDRTEAANIASNAKLNGLSDIAVFAEPVGSRPGDLRLDDIAIPPGARGFVKIDVEGAELSVLESGTESAVFCSRGCVGGNSLRGT